MFAAYLTFLSNNEFQYYINSCYFSYFYSFSSFQSFGLSHITFCVAPWPKSEYNHSCSERLAECQNLFRGKTQHAVCNQARYVPILRPSSPRLLGPAIRLPWHSQQHKPCLDFMYFSADFPVLQMFAMAWSSAIPRSFVPTLSVRLINH
jgi:hypothetical protein